MRTHKGVGDLSVWWLTLWIDAEDVLHRYIQKELEDFRQPQEDIDFIEDFCKVNNFKVRPIVK